MGFQPTQHRNTFSPWAIAVTDSSSIAAIEASLKAYYQNIMNLDAGKEDFLREFGEDYGYPNGPKSIDEIRATEFKRLEGLVYLDHAGATLYSEAQMESVFKDLTSSIYGNPHSQSDSSSATHDIVMEARRQVLDYCNASPKDYKCIFTSGATAALKLIGEAFPWSCKSNFMYTMENHNSVLGIREYALGQGASAIAVDIEDVHPAVSGDAISLRISPHQVQRRKVAQLLEGEPNGHVYNLFAFPSECNFSGSRFNLDLVKIIKEDSRGISENSSLFNHGKWMVLIDAAKGCATSPPDLSKYPADFVTVSFYKIFGYPTGLGALIVRSDAAKLLKKIYFGGGTVAASIADIDFTKRREGIEELYEDGTLSFLSIASICHGFKILNSLTMSAISRHTASLALYTRKMLSALRHGNGSSVCVLYESHNSKNDEVGPIVSFNLRRLDGSWYGYREVEKLASLSAIQLRTGCFCNPGACAKYLGLSHLDLLSNTEAGHVCWDDHDIINGKPTGAVRISFGYMSTYEEARKFVSFVASSFISPQNHIGLGNQLKGFERGSLAAGYHLKSITIYPIKSCGGFSSESWPLSNNGLKHDREWILKSVGGEILTQKKVPEMCFISTSINLSQGVLFVETPRCKEGLKIKLTLDACYGTKEDINLYGQRYEVHNYNGEINDWFSKAIGRSCTLLRYSSRHCDVVSKDARGAVMCRDANSEVNFANEAQFLLVSEESVSDLNNRLSSNVHKGICEAAIQVTASRFRPNLVVSGGRPYDEDGWTNFRIGNNTFRSLGGCNRCQMINLVQNAGQLQKSNEPLATLASYRREKGKILFGILLRCEYSDEQKQRSESWLRVGQMVYPDTVSLKGT